MCYGSDELHELGLLCHNHCHGEQDDDDEAGVDVDEDDDPTLWCPLTTDSVVIRVVSQCQDTLSTADTSY